ncbi:uncharacterized protein [Rhodnius prolixus]|uniref:uncharacterized protein n=1 Tax=Rhodnius prolixus TaxID=13249 RepID=UPI003D18B225
MIVNISRFCSGQLVRISILPLPSFSFLLISHERLTNKQKEDLRAVTKMFREASPPHLGCTDRVEHIIDTGDQPPLKQRYYPVSPFIQEAINKELDAMLEDGIVEPSSSGWSSPVVMV